MKRKNLLFTMLLTLVIAGASFAQGIVRGVVQDVNTDETLIGATVIIEGTTIGVTTSLDGSFLLISPTGEQKLVIRYVGYEEQDIVVSVKDGSTYNVGTVLLKSSAIGLDEINVLASQAINRKTPVAVSTIDAKTIENQLGSQEFPEVMKNTPNVYVTKSGGGFGDSRINVRGFDMRNVAVMINGIPVNDMENGWVYWSNWAGLGDATRTIQIQRGLGASNLAINSVGGTINIITKTSDMNKGGSIKLSATDYGQFKQMITLSSGRLKSGTAVTFVGSRTFGSEYVDATFVDAWSYFLSVSQEIGKDHQLVFTAIGAPQQHGQRDGFNMLTRAENEKFGNKYNKNWGYRGGEVLNQRVNYYHKPQFALNWYWTISEKAFLSTSFYWSFGRGGGSGGLGVSPYKYDPPQTSYNQFDWDFMSDYNAANINKENALAAGEYSVSDGDTTWNAESVNILRNSVNSHNWLGILSTLNYNLSKELTLTAGIDGRSYKGIHYREVRDLVGGDYWYDKKYGAARVGDKIAYWNDGHVTYGGLFAQLEYTHGNLSAFAAATVSNTWTYNVDYYSYTAKVGEKSEVLSNMGYNAKVGLNYNISEKHNVFVNGGYYSRVPFFRFHFLNYKNDVNENLTNEKVLAAEVGYGFTGKKLTVRFNGYYTQWKDQSMLKSFKMSDGNYYNGYLTNLNETHAGIEFNANYTALSWWKLGAIVSIGDWKYDNDATVDLYDDNTQQFVGTGTIYTKDLKVSDAPQTQYGLSTSFRIFKAIDLGLNYLYYDNMYAKFTPENRIDPTDTKQAYKLPGYGMLDVRLGWGFKFAGLDSYFQMASYNVTNEIVIIEGEDNNNHDDISKGFWSWGRTFDFSLKVNF